MKPSRLLTMGETPKPPAPAVSLGETPKTPGAVALLGEIPNPGAKPFCWGRPQTLGAAVFILGETPNPGVQPVGGDPKPRRSRSLDRAEYTVIEMIMAIAVLTLGALGVIAMQKATLIANVSARNLVTATDVAQSWMERMRIDALAWNQPAGALDLSGDTLWLKQASTSATRWLSPSVEQPGHGLPTGALQAGRDGRRTSSAATPR